MRLLPILTTVLLSIPLASLHTIHANAQTACHLPKTIGRYSTAQSKSLYSTAMNGEMYTLWETKYAQGQQTFAFKSVVKKDKQNHCYLAYSEPSGETDTMTYGVPKAVAETFAILRVKDRIKEGSKAELQKALNALKSNDSLAQEELNALRSLGLSVPATVKIIPYYTGPLHQQKIL
jgi:hypothetical protein